MSLVFGSGDGSYQAAGGYPGIARLVERFYELMDTREEASAIRAMHPADLSISKEKLTCFLSGWLGGPRLFAERFGPINIPAVHRHLNINVAERDAWLACMSLAIDEQPFSDEFKRYLLAQLAIPAERIRLTCEASAQRTGLTVAD